MKAEVETLKATTNPETPKLSPSVAAQIAALEAKTHDLEVGLATLQSLVATLEGNTRTRGQEWSAQCEAAVAQLATVRRCRNGAEGRLP